MKWVNKYAFLTWIFAAKLSYLPLTKAKIFFSINAKFPKCSENAYSQNRKQKFKIIETSKNIKPLQLNKSRLYKWKRC